MQLNRSVQDLNPFEVDCMNSVVAHRARAFFRSRHPRAVALSLSSTEAHVTYSGDQASESPTFSVESSILFYLEAGT